MRRGGSDGYRDSRGPPPLSSDYYPSNHPSSGSSSRYDNPPPSSYRLPSSSSSSSYSNPPQDYGRGGMPPMGYDDRRGGIERMERDRERDRERERDRLAPPMSVPSNRGRPYDHPADYNYPPPSRGMGGSGPPPSLSSRDNYPPPSSRYDAPPPLSSRGYGEIPTGRGIEPSSYAAGATRPRDWGGEDKYKMRPGEGAGPPPMRGGPPSGYHLPPQTRYDDYDRPPQRNKY
jgi:hypothetical protein